MSDAVKRFTHLSPEQRQLVLKKLREQQRAPAPEQATQAPPLAPLPRTGDLPLSFAQQRLWFLSQLDSGNPVYNFPPVGLRLAGRLDVGALKRSLDAICQRHEALRTTFGVVDGQPIQVIAPAASAPLSIVDLQSLGAEQETFVRQLVIGEAQRPFDLQRGPLLRVLLLRLAKDEHLLLPITHHIVFDLWSMGVFIRELTKLYQAFSSGASPLLPDLTVQPADFAVWQRQWLQGQVLETQLAYWKQHLAGAPAALDLPTDRPRPAVQTYRGAKLTFNLAAPLTAALKTLSQRENVTLFMTLLAAFETLLYRYTGQPDIVVGSPIANRNRSEIEELIGCFVNTLALRTHLDGSTSFRNLLKQVRQATLNAYAHQDLPFEMLVEELRPERSLSRSPIFQVMFVLQNMQNLQNVFQETFTLPELTLSPLEFDSGIARFDLALSMMDTASGLLGVLEYNTDLFDPATIARLADHFQILLEGIVAEGEDSERRIADLPLLSAAERQKLLVEWNATRVDDPLAASACLPDRFEAQVQRSPDAVAVVFEDQQVTYQNLNQRANRLAHHLQALGVRAEVRVGVCLERSLEMAIGLLGVLKAGGAYVPLDPTCPAERLAFMLEDAQAPLLLTQSTLVDRLPAHSAHVICFDGESPIANRLSPTSDLQLPISPDNLAYVIYTSGSTGRPKGVQVSHRAVLNFLSAMQRQPGLTHHDTLLAVTRLSFDIAGLELYLPLTTGARLEIASQSVAADGELLREKLIRSGITVMQATPATWRLLLAAGWSGGDGFKALCGGEALSRDLADQLLDKRVALWNLYGPTETTIWSSVYRVESRQGTVPIGRPIANTQLYVLDAALNPTPIGVPGELYIGGDGLARGYLGRPDLTAERFLPNPFTDDCSPITDRSSVVSEQWTVGRRLYRTGDLARYLPDGAIEFLGRVDYQVKLRGFRIELGEIEAALSRHPAVRAAVASARKDESGEQRLVAYVAPNDWQSASGEVDQAHLQQALRDSLKKSLPEYMLPSALMLLEKLPLTPSGKIDRRALPAPDQTRPELENAFVAARTPVEEVLAGIWAEVLDLDRVGVGDNFFELGGHSLLATRTIARVRQAFHVELPLRDLFEEPTIASLAARVAGRMGKPENSERSTALPVLNPAPGERHQPFPLTDVQQAYWIGRRQDFELGNVATHIYLEIESAELDVERLELAWQRLIARHGMLRAIVRPDGQQQILEQVAPYRIEVLDARDQGHAAVVDQLEATRRRMSHQVLPSDQWPLFEIRASRLDGERVRLHVSLDVLIGDAWSWQVLSRELARLYQDADTALAPLDLSFRDYVLAEINLRRTELYQRSLAYWRSRAATLPPAPELPLATSPTLLSQPRFVRRQARLEREAWRRLKKRAARAGLTPSGVLLAAFAEVLATWSKNPRFTLNLTLFHRLPLHRQVDEIVGDFTSLTLLEVDCSEPESFEARARRLQGRLWEDLDHGYVSGVQVLREMAQVQGGASRVAMPVVFTSTLVQAARREPAVNLLSATHSKMVYSITQTPQVWLDHQVSEEQGALTISWDAVEELFPSGLLDDLFEAYRCLLQRLIEEDAAWQSTARHLTPPAQLKQREDINATAAPIATELLHALFAVQVSQRRDHLAVISGRRNLTYGELHRCSNQVGHWLRGKGVQPRSDSSLAYEHPERSGGRPSTSLRSAQDVPAAQSKDAVRQLGNCPNHLVAVVMEKGWEQAAAVLGILKAGAAYIPIDPELPPERVAYLLQHSQAELALTQSWVEPKIEWPDFIQRLCVDGDLNELDDRPLEAVQRPEDLAYVIYTSGSTGLPKGVMIDHRGAINTILDINRRFKVTPQDRVLALSSLSFDLSVYDIFGVLAAGGTIVIPDAASRRDPAHWAELIRRERVTLWNSVPALMEMLVEYLEGRAERLPDSLRIVFMSGDWIPVNLPDRIKSLAEGIQVFSGGGATEASIWSILYPIDQVDPAWTSIPYGKPMANQSLHVLDEHLEPRPMWVPGNLYIGGIGLAKGYWRDEAKTQASFIIHPTMGRLYRTGDLGRYLPDGHIEFLGREDFQVKIRGHRIELGEIETALLQHPAVRAGAVTAIGEMRGDKRLVAYVVVDREIAPAPQAADDGLLLQDDAPAQAEGILLDPIERLKFKLAHPGLRRDHGDRRSVRLAQPKRDADLIKAHVARRSYRKFEPGLISFERFSRFLSCLFRIELEGVPLPKAQYGSAGGLYPVQTYLYVKPDRVEGFTEGTYYYHPEEHRLMLLSADAHLDPALYQMVNRAIFDASAFALFFVGQLDAITPLYGNYARDFCLLEAGLMTQLLEMSAPGCEIGLCQIGGFGFDAIRHWFALNESQVYLHGLLGGGIDAGQTQLPALIEDSGEMNYLMRLIQETPEEKPALASGNLARVGLETYQTAREPSQGFATEPIVEALQSFLRTKLPDYMTPATFVLLDSLPLTPNGKVDRRALPPPDQIGPEPEKTFAVPQTDLEQAIAAIWQEVLQIEAVSVHDSFFELGGNSVHLIRVHGKLRETLGKDLPVVKMFERPTVRSLADYISQEQERPFSFQPSADRADARHASRQRRTQARRQAGSNVETGDSE